jgi:hypothetical protein
MPRVGNAYEPGALPNLVVVGAMKSGTSSLHFYLGRHPEIQMSEPKELHFFVDTTQFEPGPYALSPGETAPLRGDGNWNRGVTWYRRHFDPTSSIRGESTVAYSFPWYPGVPERMAKIVPDTRIIYVVRDPVERMVSHYLAYRQAGREPREMEEVLNAAASQYLAASCYRTILDGFLERFERSQLMIVDQGALMTRRRETLSAIFSFLDVDSSYWTDQMSATRNTFESKGPALRTAERLARTSFGRTITQRLPTSFKARTEARLASTRTAAERPTLASGTRAMLLRRLEPEIQGVEELTGWNLDRWRGI